jgi:CheY-like chemotaxis protein
MPGPVLVIDDDADTRRMIAEYLSFLRIHTVEAAHGLEGLQALREHHPSVVLLDLMMPVMDGWEFRRRQQEFGEPGLAGTPVIVISEFPDSERHAAILGAVDSIAKPIDFERLTRLVLQFDPD